jgi:hypothetical protein
MSDTPRTDAITRRAVDGTGCLTNPQALWDGLEQLERELAEARQQRDTLVDAAQAVVNRWDAPTWKELESTAKLISALRKAIAAVKGGDA